MDTSDDQEERGSSFSGRWDDDIMGDSPSSSHLSPMPSSSEAAYARVMDRSPIAASHTSGPSSNVTVLLEGEEPHTANEGHR